MSTSGVRFRPPAVELTPELRWVLSRSFRPPGAPLPPSVQASRVVDLARRLALAPRIASRLGRQALAAELGEETAAAFHQSRLVTTARELRLAACTQEVAEVADRHELPVAFLKYMALSLEGALLEGSRDAGDLDVLVPSTRTEELQAILVEGGWRASQVPAKEHQLPALHHSSGCILEIHRLILGVRLSPGAPSATLETLEAAGLLRPVAELPGRCAVPVREVLAAHALAHGLGQHGFDPATYPALRMVADLLDLGLGGEEGAELAGRVFAYVERDLSRAEVAAARALCRRLEAGDEALWSEAPEDSGEACLLHHFLAGALDEDYRRSLRFVMLGRPLTDRSRLGGAAAALARAVWPSRAELAAIYGPPSSPLGALALRVGRPFDLIRRAWVYGWSLLRSRLHLRRLPDPEGGGERPDRESLR